MNTVIAGSYTGGATTKTTTQLRINTGATSASILYDLSNINVFNIGINPINIPINISDGKFNCPNKVEIFSFGLFFFKLKNEYNNLKKINITGIKTINISLIL